MPSLKLSKSRIEGQRDALQTRRLAGEKVEPVELNDTELRGLTCRVNPDGRCTFMLRYRVAGQSRRVTLGTLDSMSVEQARKAGGAAKVAVHGGADPAAERRDRRQAPTVAELCDRYLTEHAERHKKPSSVKQDRRMVEKRVRPAFGQRLAREVQPKHVAELIHKLSGMPTEANRVRALLSKMFSLAELWGLRDANSNPVRGIQRFKEKRRERLLSDAEMRAALDALAALEAEQNILPGAALAIRLLWLSGCRMSEVINLEWRFVDQAAAEIRWPDSKSGDEMVKPLTAEVRRLLDGAERVVGNPFVCFGSDRAKPLPVSTLEKTWRRVLDRAGVAPCGLHALRHLMATELARSGADVETVRRLMGHKTAQTTLRYFQTTADHQRAAIARLAGERARKLAAAETAPVASVVPLRRKRA
jgi:integrase